MYGVRIEGRHEKVKGSRGYLGGITLEKEILIRYCEVREEVRDLRRRIEKTEKEIDHLDIVSDSVKGTRPDGTYGAIRITGYPTPEYYQKKAALERYKKVLELKEAELLEEMTRAEEIIESIEKPELRMMMRLYYIDGLTWAQVAERMNRTFPKSRFRYTEGSCWRRNQRFFGKN